MDSLEKFIKENRAELDRKVPDPMLWLQIEKNIQAAPKPAKRVRMNRWLRAIAAGFALLLLGAAAGIWMTNDQHIEDLAFEGKEEFLEAEDYYQSRVNLKMVAFNKLEQKDESIEGELEALDKVFMELKSELLNSVHKDKDIIVNAMIKNYKKKIRILERVLERSTRTNIINDKKNTQNENLEI